MKPAKTHLPNYSLGDHVCSIYKNAKEQFGVAMPFIKEGLELNQKCIYIVDENTKERVFAELAKAGIDVNTYINSKQLLLLTKDETYVKDGSFDPNRMIQLFKKTETEAMEEGYNGLRITGEMTWALKGIKGSDGLINYETKLNSFFPTSKSLAICQYNEKAFDKDTLAEVLHTHPKTIIYGTPKSNDTYFAHGHNADQALKPFPKGSYDTIRNDILSS